MPAKGESRMRNPSGPGFSASATSGAVRTELRLNEANEEDRQQQRAAGGALIAGLLLHFAILFLWGDSPSDMVGVLTGIFPDIPYDRYLKYPLSVLFSFYSAGEQSSCTESR